MCHDFTQGRIMVSNSCTHTAVTCSTVPAVSSGPRTVISTPFLVPAALARAPFSGMSLAAATYRGAPNLLASAAGPAATSALAPNRSTSIPAPVMSLSASRAMMPAPSPARATLARCLGYGPVLPQKHQNYRGKQYLSSRVLFHLCVLFP